VTLRIVTTSFPAYPSDSAGHFVLAHARVLARALGRPVRVLAGGQGDWQPVPTQRYGGRLFAADGAPDRLQKAPLSGGLLAADATLRLRRMLPKFMPRGAPAIAHWLLPTALLVAARGPTLAIAHGGDVALLERLPMGRAMARRIDAQAFAVSFVSADLRARFEALAGPQRCPHPVLPMGIAPFAPDLDFAESLRQRAGGRPIIATVGRRVPIKGFDVLDAALEGRDDVCWFAAGDGPQPLRNAEDLGQLEPPQRDGLLAIADLVVVPSRRVGRRVEGTPLALLEALQSGAPVIATRTGGMATVDGPVFVEPDDPEALRGAIGQVLRDASMRRPPRRPHGAHGWDTVGPAHAGWAQRLLRFAGDQASPN
jgi:glycosyltransferase involved in cell wall biosynthesis